MFNVYHCGSWYKPHWQSDIDWCIPPVPKGIYHHSKDGTAMTKAALITDFSAGVKCGQFQNIHHIVVTCRSFANLLSENQ